MVNKIITSIALLVLGVLSFKSFAVEQLNPRADKNSVVQIGNARFTVLTPSLVRLEYSSQKAFRDTASLVVVNRLLPVPKYTHQTQGDVFTLKTENLKISYKFTTGDFNKNNLEITSIAGSKAFNWQPGDQDTNNLGGTARTLDGMNGGIDWNGKPVDLGHGIASRSGWYLLDDSKSHNLLGIGDETKWPWVSAIENEGYQDWYFFGHGLEYKQALFDYTQIAGKIPLPPRYAFGYWWSRYWVYSDREFRELMTQMRGYDIPIDVLIIDMDWHLTHGGLKDIKNPKRDPFGELLGWTGYTWNRELFPEPEAFLGWTEDFNLKTALNLHPASGIPPMESQYQDFANRYGFDTSKNEYIPYRMGEKKWAQTYVDTILRPMEDQGVDFWWLDWQQFPESRVVDGLSNTWWLNYVFFTDMERQNKRPMLFHRWGGMGNHRYQIGFSGDDKISWESLAYQTYFTPTASNVGYGYWSHDIGGHASGELDKDPELYLRWLQFGIFSPILRTHSAKISSIERRFWMFPEYFDQMRELVKFRYRLNPYIYGAARQAYDTGVSMLRPMYYDYPEQDQAYSFKYQYMFGDDMLVAPIARAVADENLLAEKKIWLPEGRWYELYTGNLLAGDQVVTRYYVKDEIPVFVKAGAVLPMYHDVDHLQGQVSQFNLTIVPGEAGDAMLYEDSGDGLGYKAGEFSTTQIKQRLGDNGVQYIEISPRQGRFADMEDKRTFTLTLPTSMPVSKVLVNGKKLDDKFIEYQAEQLANVIRLPEESAAKRLYVELITDKTLTSKKSLLFGKIGQFNRVRKAVADLKIEVARSSWWATLPNIVLGIEQTPTKIAYQKSKLLPLLESFDNNYPKMMPLIRAHKDARSEVAERYIQFLSK